MSRIKNILSCLLIILIGVPSASAQVQVRVKDIASVQGIRENQLIGYGLVIGLKKSGDDGDTLFTVQSIASMLERLGVSIDKERLKIENVAGVIVTAVLPPFVKQGSKIDITVSSFGNADSLAGGILLMTPLKGPDNKVYAVAQGPISLGGIGGSQGNNHPTVGFVPGGALIEKEVPMNFLQGTKMSLTLYEPDFTSANRLTEVINGAYPGVATALDAATVRVDVPQVFLETETVIKYIASIEKLSFVPDSTAKVIVNEKTGTIVAGEYVKISTVAISHGNLSVTIKADEMLAQEETLGNPEKKTKEIEARVIVVDKGVNVGEIARALNMLGVTPQDMIAIFNAIKRAGALQAELIIM